MKLWPRVWCLVFLTHCVDRLSSELQKMADSIDMRFGMKTSVGPRDHVLGGGPVPPRGRGNLGAVPLYKMHCNSDSAKNVDTYRQHMASATYGRSSFTGAHLHLCEKKFEERNCANRHM